MSVGLGNLRCMRALVVGAGAWGLPAAAELARRGHQVTLLDRHGPGNALSSSPGPTRLWRLTHPDGVRVRLALRSVEAMRRLERLTGEIVHLRRGLVWRDDPAGVEAVGAALGAEGVRHEVTDPGDVGRHLPGLVPDGRPAVYVDEAGPVLAEASLRAQLGLLHAHGGSVETGRRVLHVERGGGGVRLHLDDGEHARRRGGRPWRPGPGPRRCCATSASGCRCDPGSSRSSTSATPPTRAPPTATPVWSTARTSTSTAPRHRTSMPCRRRAGATRSASTEPLRDLVEGDDDRTPDEATTAFVVERVRRGITGVTPRALDAQVCCWTESPDGRFVIDTLPGGVVVGCGDSGEGFKFSAVMGLLLADLAEGRAPEPDVAAFGLARFTGQASPGPGSRASGAPASSR